MEVVVIILVLILLNGLFSMSESAMESARKARLEFLANKGDEKAKTALKLANNPNKFLSTVQIGITLISILIGIYSGATWRMELIDIVAQVQYLAPYSHGIATAIIVLVITYFTIVLGELVPK